MHALPSSAEDLPGPWTHRQANVNGVRLHYVEAGEGPLVVLLHGFPEFWYGWRLQIPALAQAGCRVVAPDLRGYNLSSKPSGVANYRTDCLTGDVAALIQHAGQQRATVVGHDWGGIVAWHLAMSRPECIERLVILNAPHPALFARALRSGTQLRKSWYVLFFQLPVLPELYCRWDRFAVLCGSLRDDPGGSQPRVSERDLTFYRRALSRPGALTAAINYYRASLRQQAHGTSVRPITAPTLVLWGERDRYLGTELLEGLEQWVSSLEVMRFPEASHWLAADEADAVNREIVRFMGPAAGQG
jgi:pimeloyl-ACP methyl ester carboxylesterase